MTGHARMLKRIASGKKYMNERCAMAVVSTSDTALVGGHARKLAVTHALAAA